MTRSRARYRHHGVIDLDYNNGESEISCCVKYSVFGFNVLFWVLGLALLGIGLWAQVEKNSPYSQLNRASKIYLDPAWLVVMVGGITFILGFSGCIGALRENTWLLAFYSTVLGLLLLAEMSSAVVVFFSKEWIDVELQNRLDEMIIMYRDDADLQTLIDWMQADWHCCGITKADDWDKNVYFNSSSSAFRSPEAGGVPFSCCSHPAAGEGPELANLFCGHGVRLGPRSVLVEVIHTEGCLPKLQDWLNHNILYVSVALVIVATTQILGICFAQNLRSDIFAQRAKWYLQH